MWGELVQRTVVGIVILILSTAASFFIGRWVGNYRARRQWANKDFMDRVIVSFNLFRDGKLKIRTLLERSLSDVFQNAVAVEKVQEAARQTTLANPLLPIHKEDVWYVLNFVLNAVAEKFSAGIVREDAGENVSTITYAICLTCELIGDERIRKVRALLVRRELLLDFPYLDRMPELENAWHDVRVETLRKMAEVYRTHPENFLTLEIAV